MNESDPLVYRKVNVMISITVAGVGMLVLAGVIGFIVQGGQLSRMAGRIERQEGMIRQLESDNAAMARQLADASAKLAELSARREGPRGPATNGSPIGQPAGVSATDLIRVLQTEPKHTEATLAALRGLSALGEASSADALMIAQLLQRAEMYGVALEWADLAVNVRDGQALDEAGQAKAHYVAGRSLAKLGRRDEAMRRFRQAIQADDGFVDAHLALVELLSGWPSGDGSVSVQEAATMARSLLMVARQNPGDLPLALCAARAAVKGGLEAEALEAYRLVHQSDPTEPEAALALATEALNAGQLDAALRIALPAAEKAGSARLWSLVGLVYKKNNQPDNAVAAWRKSLAVDANQGDLWREIGAIFAERGDLSEALDAAQKALAANPNDAAAWYYLAVIQANGRELDEAIQSASRSLSLEPRFAAAYYLLAVLHGRRGNADAAYSALIEAFAIDPSLREKARNSGDFRGLADASARFRELLGPARSTTAPAQP